MVAQPPSSPPEIVAPHVLIAGAGIAALEAALALRAHADRSRLRITLLSPNRQFLYPPLAVLAPFSALEPATLPLDTFAADADVDLRHGLLAGVRVGHRTAETSEGAAVAYDALLIAMGARPEHTVEGAVPFRGAHDAERVGALLDDLVENGGGTIVFVAPDAAAWSLPIYELALLAAAYLRNAGVAAEVSIVTDEHDPLAVFGQQSSAAARAKLDAHGVRLYPGLAVAAVRTGSVELSDGRRLPADHVVALPTQRPRPLDGLRTTRAGFLPIDDHARVIDCPAVYAAGDVTAGPVKQGGLACQQADAAAEAILADLGHPITPAPYRPVLRGILLSDEDPDYLRASLPSTTREPGPAAVPRVRRLAWPSGKIVGHHLSPYLEGHTELPRTPEHAVPVTRRPRSAPDA